MKNNSPVRLNNGRLATTVDRNTKRKTNNTGNKQKQQTKLSILQNIEEPYVNSHNVLPIKCGFMTKRSQNKKRFTPVNYKVRWFELDKHYLRYYDVENAEVSENVWISFFFLLFSLLMLRFVFYFHTTHLSLKQALINNNNNKK